MQWKKWLRRNERIRSWKKPGKITSKHRIGDQVCGMMRMSAYGRTQTITQLTR